MTLEVVDLSVAYDGHAVVHGLTVRVPTAGWLGLIGPNGAGKTSLLRSMAGLVPFSGTARIEGTLLSDAGARRLAQLVAYVPQRPEIPGSMAISDYVLLGRTPYIPYLGRESPPDMEVVARVLDRLALGSLAGRQLASLSGGELQRAVLARALAQEAPVLLLDEPTAALDVGHQQQVMELVDELRMERRLTVVSAMHDLTLAGQFADHLLLLDRGHAVAFGPAAAVLTEATIRKHYGAAVRIFQDIDGQVVVLPIRTRARVSLQLEVGPSDG